MNNTLAISVVVPVYNVEKYLRQCIDSILAQSFTCFELLLIDDGSSDNSGDICEEYAKKDERIRIFQQENAGVSATRNRGMNEAKGRYVAFVDSDDWVEANYLKDLYEALSDYATEGLVIEGVKKVHPNGTIEQIPLQDIQLNRSEIYQLLTELIGSGLGYSYGKLYDISLVRKNNLSFSSDISLLEDWIFLLDYAVHATFVTIKPVFNYCYRVAYSSLTLSTRKYEFEKEYILFKAYQKRIVFYQQKYNLNNRQMDRVWLTLTTIFHRPILSLYLSSYHYRYKERVLSLRKLHCENKEWITVLFSPSYGIDKIAKFLLLHNCYFLFDSWMKFWIGLKCKYMFGVRMGD